MAADWKRCITDPKWQFRAALVVVVAASFVHMMALPLVVSWDGMQYVHLANVLSQPATIAHWNFDRTPLFPLFLHCAFYLGGEQPQAAVLATSLAGLGGVLVTAFMVRRIAGERSAAITLLVVTFYPVLVGYQHMLLSETGTFCLIALLLCSLICLAPLAKRFPIAVGCWTALVVGIGYYWRPTILALSPVAAICFVLLVAKSPRRIIAGDRRVFTGALIVAIAPWLLAYPWRHLTNEYSPNTYRAFFAAGMFKEVLVPPRDPVLSPVRAEYEAAIQEDSVNGHLPLDGVTIGHHQALLHRVMDLLVNAGVGNVARKYPGRYASRVAKAFLFFLGLPDHRIDDENWNFSHAVFRMWPPMDRLDRQLGWDARWLEFNPQVYTGGAAVGRSLDDLLPLYTWAVLMASCISFAWFVVSVVRVNAIGITLTAIPFAFLFLHALTLQADDRYAFPVYPIMLANVVMLVRAAADAILNRDDEGRPHV